MKFGAIFAFLLGNTAFRYDYPKNASDAHAEGAINETYTEGHSVNETKEPVPIFLDLDANVGTTPVPDPDSDPDSDSDDFHFDDHEPTEVDVAVDVETDYEEENFTMQVHKTTHKQRKTIKPLETKEPPQADPTVDYSIYNGDEKKKAKDESKENEEKPLSAHHKFKAAMQALVCPKKKEINLAFENGIFFGVFLACLVYAVIHILKTHSSVTTYILLAGAFFLCFLWYQEENILGETLFIEEKILGFC